MDVSQPDQGGGRTYRGAGPQQRQRERRAKLVDAAIEVFGTTGYRHATVGAICAKAGVAKRNFYESFADNEAILLATYQVSTERMREAIVAGAQAHPTDIGPRVRGGVLGFFHVIGDDPRIARIAFFEILGVSATMDDMYRQTTESFVDTFLELVGVAIAATSTPPVPMRTIATGLVGAALLIAQQWVLDECRAPVTDVADSTQVILWSVLDRLTDH